jgi:hypothetical protein
MQEAHYQSLGFASIYRYYASVSYPSSHAKQFFGLADFKNYQQNQLTHAVNIAFTVLIVSQIVLEKYKKILSKLNISITDLKAIQNAQMCYQYFLNTSKDSPDDLFNDEIFLSFTKLYAINSV